MTYNPLENEYLKIKDGVQRTEVCDRVICLLDPFFKHFMTKAVVSSAYRTPLHQLRIIIDYANKRDLPVNFTPQDIDAKDEKGRFLWQYVWSLLLNQGIIINPPRPAEVLYDYYNASGINRRGDIIDVSSHTKGIAFDIAKAYPTQDVALFEPCIKYAMLIQPDLGIKGYLLEPKNDCIHVTCKETIPNETPIA